MTVRGRKPIQPVPDPNIVAGVTAAAAVAGVHRRTVYRWIEEGRISAMTGVNEMWHYHPIYGAGPFFDRVHLLLLGRYAAKRREEIEKHLDPFQDERELIFGVQLREERIARGEPRPRRHRGGYTVAEEKEKLEWPEDLPLRPEEVAEPLETFSTMVLPWEESLGVPKPGYRGDGRRLRRGESGYIPPLQDQDKPQETPGGS